MKSPENILALDVGAVRIGVARANLIARIAEPLKTIPNDETVTHTIAALIEDEKAATVVVGLPQNQQYQDTEQTTFVRDFVAHLEKSVAADFVFQDEAGSSQRAESILKERGKPFAKEAIDAEAATLILQDYIEEQL